MRRQDQERCASITLDDQALCGPKGTGDRRSPTYAMTASPTRRLRTAWSDYDRAAHVAVSARSLAARCRWKHRSRLFVVSDQWALTSARFRSHFQADRVRNVATNAACAAEFDHPDRTPPFASASAVTSTAKAMVTVPTSNCTGSPAPPSLRRSIRNAAHLLHPPSPATVPSGVLRPDASAPLRPQPRPRFDLTRRPPVVRTRCVTSSVTLPAGVADRSRAGCRAAAALEANHLAAHSREPARPRSSIHAELWLLPFQSVSCQCRLTHSNSWC